MPLSWNEIKARALTFSRTWADADSEDSEAKPFWIDFFEIFGITDKRVATFELNVKKLGAAQGFVDLFWPGMLLVEHKSRGKDLDRAFRQALGYFPGLPERDLPQLINQAMRLLSAPLALTPTLSQREREQNRQHCRSARNRSKNGAPASMRPSPPSSNSR